MPSNHLILCCPPLLLPSVFPNIRVFSSESVLHIRRPKYWSFSFSITPSNEYSGLISFRMDWLNLLAVRGTFKSSPTPQFKSINSLALNFLYSPTLISIHDYGKTIPLTTWTFVGKVMSLLFNILSRLVVTFLPRSEHLLISWLQSPSAVILESQKIKSPFPQYMNHELPDVQARFRKGKGIREQVANICWIIEKAREFQKNIYFCFIDICFC